MKLQFKESDLTKGLTFYDTSRKFTIDNSDESTVTYSHHFLEKKTEETVPAKETKTIDKAQSHTQETSSKSTFTDKSFEEAMEKLSLNKDELKKVQLLTELRSQDKTLSDDQVKQILSNPKFNDEIKLVYLTYMNVDNPEQVLKDHYENLAKEADKEYEQKHGISLTKGVAKTSKNAAQIIQTASRFTFD